MPTLRDFLERGYFPRELSPPFTTSHFAEVVAQQVDELPGAFFDQNRRAKVDTRSLARVGMLKRSLCIPNPVHQFRLVKEIYENWKPIAR